MRTGVYYMGTPEFDRLMSYTELQRAVRERERESGTECERARV